MATRSHSEAIYLGLDVNAFLGIFIQPCYVNLHIEVADTAAQLSQCLLTGLKDSLADDGILRHNFKMPTNNDVPIARSGHKYVAPRCNIVHRCHFIACHSGLKSINGVDFGNDDTSAVRLKGLSALIYAMLVLRISIREDAHSFANITVAGDNSDFSG